MPYVDRALRYLLLPVIVLAGLVTYLSLAPWSRVDIPAVPAFVGPPAPWTMHTMTWLRIMPCVHRAEAATATPGAAVDVRQGGCLPLSPAVLRELFDGGLFGNDADVDFRARLRSGAALVSRREFFRLDHLVTVWLSPSGRLRITYAPGRDVRVKAEKPGRERHDG